MNQRKRLHQEDAPTGQPIPLRLPHKLLDEATQNQENPGMHFRPQRPPNEPDLFGQAFDKFRHSKELAKPLKRARTTELTNIGAEQRSSRKLHVMIYSLQELWLPIV
jgi:hypothetical protein